MPLGGCGLRTLATPSTRTCYWAWARCPLQHPSSSDQSWSSPQRCLQHPVSSGHPLFACHRSSCLFYHLGSVRNSCRYSAVRHPVGSVVSDRYGRSYSLHICSAAFFLTQMQFVSCPKLPPPMLACTQAFGASNETCSSYDQSTTAPADPVQLDPIPNAGLRHLLRLHFDTVRYTSQRFDDCTRPSAFAELSTRIIVQELDHSNK